jgi:putative tryptophan/tyrosine transport system substrate-binding protein
MTTQPLSALKMLLSRHTRRREFITLLGGAAVALVAWPLAARAQQGDRVRRIGVLMPLTEGDQEAQARKAVFEQRLNQLGWTVGGNLQIDYHLAGGDADRIRQYATELVAVAPDVIMTFGSATVGPVQQRTRAIPIVMVNVADRIGRALSRAWRGREATLPDSPISNTV